MERSQSWGIRSKQARKERIPIIGDEVEEEDDGVLGDPFLSLPPYLLFTIDLSLVFSLRSFTLL